MNVVASASVQLTWDNPITGWSLVPSVSSVKYDRTAKTYTPNKIGISVLRHTGGETVSVAPNSEGLSLSMMLMKPDGTVAFPLNPSADRTEWTVTSLYRQEAAYIEAKLSVDGTEVDRKTIAVMVDGVDGADGEPGNDGEDALSLIVSSDSVTFRENGVQQTQYLTMQLFRGSQPVAYGGTDGWTCTRPVAPANIVMGTTADGTSVTHEIQYSGVGAVQTSLPFVIYLGTQRLFEREITVMTVSDGKDGKRGPALRGPLLWEDCADGFQFFSGAEGEQFLDVVLHNEHFYSCKQSHTKASTREPMTEGGDAYWQAAASFDFVATKLLLAKMAIIKNLGAEAIVMKDADGNIVFEAKDGAVTCNTGQFNGITAKDAQMIDAQIQSGRIGNLAIQGNEICGYDADGNKVVSVGVGELPSPAEALPQKAVKLTEATTSTAEAAANITHGAIDTATATKLATIIEGSTADATKNPAKLQMSLKFTLAAPMRKLTFGGLRYEIANKVNVTISSQYTEGTLKLYKVGGSVPLATATFLESALDYELTPPRGSDSFAAGDYRSDLELTVNATPLAADHQWQSNVYIHLGGGIVGTLVANEGNVKCLHLTGKGMLSIGSATNYMLHSFTEGFEARFGNAGIQCGADGLRKFDGTEWVDL